ncbi:hypothetical protein [Nocardioides caldifontis]|uniref:hypothetical protein n=1 Tax=Nocardioides caldifontis TaxID=2588938 RepID=UPI0011DFDC9F|nr:hypothetical protein [Nocardioides caldifontis]
MYGENGGRLRAELAQLLRQHRIQQRLGGAGSHTMPVTTSPAQRTEFGRQMNRFRLSALVWCRQTAVAVGPFATSNLAKPPANPFRTPKPDPGPLAALHQALDEAAAASTARLPHLEELTTPHDVPIVESWRQIARAAALGEHDFGAGLNDSLTAQQCQTVVADVAAITQALVTLDRRYLRIPGWESLANAPRLGWAALACALDSSLEPPDYSVDLRGWRPPTKLIKGPARPGLVGVLQAEHNLVLRMRSFPSAINLRLVVDSQKLLSAGLARLAAPVDRRLADKWLTRATTYATLQRELRDVGGRLGTGGPAVLEGANAVSRLNALPADTSVDPRVLHGFDVLFTSLDTRIADVIEQGISRDAYFLRVKVSRVVENSGQMVAPTQERFMPLADAQHPALDELVRSKLRPAPEAPTPPTGAARSRAELHAAIVHSPDKRNHGLSA